jgi:hypothetical protein
MGVGGLSLSVVWLFLYGLFGTYAAVPESLGRT